MKIPSDRPIYNANIQLSNIGIYLSKHIRITQIYIE